MRIGGQESDLGFDRPYKSLRGEGNIVAAIVLDGGGEVEAPGPVFCP